MILLWYYHVTFFTMKATIYVACLVPPRKLILVSAAILRLDDQQASHNISYLLIDRGILWNSIFLNRFLHIFNWDK